MPYNTGQLRSTHSRVKPRIDAGWRPETAPFECARGRRVFPLNRSERARGLKPGGFPSVAIRSMTACRTARRTPYRCDMAGWRFGVAGLIARLVPDLTPRYTAGSHVGSVARSRKNRSKNRRSTSRNNSINMTLIWGITLPAISGHAPFHRGRTAL